jgi:hypothetical protein
MAEVQEPQQEDPTIRGALGRLGMMHPTAATLVVVASKETKLPPEVIWKAWSNLEQWPRWSKPLVQSARWLEGRDWQVGSKFELTRSLGAPVGRQVSVETVREVNPGQSVGWWEGKSAMKGCHLWFFEPLPEGGTRIHKTEVFIGMIPFLFKPIMRRSIKKLFEEAIDGLIKYAERNQNA